MGRGAAISRPLLASKEAKMQAAQWHREVFALFGNRCYLHVLKNPRSKMAATDAAHVVARSRLGTAWAYASPLFGRGLCRGCHDAQGAGLDPMFRFPWRDVADVISEYNMLPTRDKLRLPEPWVDAWKK
jgi:hypothetical protein